MRGNNQALLKMAFFDQNNKTTDQNYVDYF
jgi:hypothetical protein